MTAVNTAGDTERFNRWARTYESSWLQNLYFDRVHKVVLNLVAEESGRVEPHNFLDVGCGTGRLLRKVGARWPTARLVGVDAAAAMVEVAHHLTPAATFHVAAAESMPIPDASVDVVLSTASFHHWDDQPTGVREVARVLRPGGRFFLADMATVPDGLMGLLCRLSPNNPHLRAMSPARLRAIVERAGLRVGLQRRAVGPLLLVTVAAKG